MNVEIFIRHTVVEKKRSSTFNFYTKKLLVCSLCGTFKGGMKFCT